MDRREVDEKVLQFEAFINEKLKNDLKNILDTKDQLCEQLAEYSQLKSTIEKLQESGIKEDLETRMDIGCNFYMEAVVPDPSKILVCIGYSFFAELTHAEALQFIPKKVESLEKRIDHLSNQANHVKARIKLLLEGLRELQNISPSEETRRIEI